jgi:hypothetical protein
MRCLRSPSLQGGEYVTMQFLDAVVATTLGLWLPIGACQGFAFGADAGADFGRMG